MREIAFELASITGIIGFVIWLVVKYYGWFGLLKGIGIFILCIALTISWFASWYLLCWSIEKVTKFTKDDKSKEL